MLVINYCSDQCVNIVLILLDHYCAIQVPSWIINLKLIVQFSAVTVLVNVASA